MNCGLQDDVGTLEAWIWMPAQIPATHGTILRLDGGGPWSYHILQRDMSSSVISYTVYDGRRGQAVRSGTLAEGWHHVAATHDVKAGQIELFIDGRSVGKSACLNTMCARACSASAACPTTRPVRSAIRCSGSSTRSAFQRSCATRRPTPPGPSSPMPTRLAFTTSTSRAAPPGHDQPGGQHARASDIRQQRHALRRLRLPGALLRRAWYAPGEIGLVCPHTADAGVTGADRRHRRHGDALDRREPRCTCRRPRTPCRHEDSSAGGCACASAECRRTGQSLLLRLLRPLPQGPSRLVRPGLHGGPAAADVLHEPRVHPQVIQDARDYFDGKGDQAGRDGRRRHLRPGAHGQQLVVQVPPLPGRAEPGRKRQPEFNNGKASDYIFDFVNQVAREVAQDPSGQVDRGPGLLRPTPITREDQARAQHRGADVPAHAQLVVPLDGGQRPQGAPPTGASHEPDRPLYLWLYYCFPALNATSGNFHYFPGFFAHKVVPQMKLYHEANIRGMFMEQLQRVRRDLPDGPARVLRHASSWPTTRPWTATS